jgi:hypothetical protein
MEANRENSTGSPGDAIRRDLASLMSIAFRSRIFHRAPQIKKAARTEGPWGDGEEE